MKRSLYPLSFLLAFFLAAPSEAKGHRISELGIRHSGCRGRCPVYSFLVKRDGSFEYYGYRFVVHKGEWTGTVDRTLLGRILIAIESSRFMGFNAKYRRGVTDMDTVYTTVVMDGTKKIVEDYARSGPPELRSIEQAIGGLINTAKWDKH